MGVLFVLLPFLLAAVPSQTEADEYTLYELLAPESAKFHILYEITATTPGATVFFNPIRKGSEASDEAAFDQATGLPVPLETVSGAVALASGLSDADMDMSYLRIRLPRPVPEDGGVRLLIEKTYRDPKSYFREGDRIVFSRGLGVKRNAVLLPTGFELVSLNVPSQILQGKDGRTIVSFMNPGPGEAPLLLKARRLP